MEFHAHNAATGEKLTPAYRDASAAEIASVARAAQDAFEPYAALSPEERAVFLETIAEEMLARSGPLLERAQLETGLPAPRVENERNRTVMQLRLFASLIREGSWVDARIDRAQPDRKPQPRPDLRRMLLPLGPVAVFGASNFPFAYSVAGGDTASALAAGNPVVVKAHPAHPGTSDLTAEIVRAAIAKRKLPGGVFGMVHGASPEVSLALVKHPAITAVGFTGSLRAGRALFDAAAARPVPIPVFAEMGSVNPVFVLPGALAERGATIAEGFTSSFTLGVGQFCTKPGLIFGMESASWKNFADDVANRARAVPKGVMLHAGIEDAFARGVAGLRDVEWLVRGPAHVARVSAAPFVARPELAHEIFGPYTLLVTASDPADLVAIANKLEGQLTASVHGTDAELRAASELITTLTRRAGRVICNGFPTGVEVVPSMNHGGPYPATTDVRFTSVGTAAILRFARPVCYQGFADDLLPPALQNANPLGLTRLVDGKLTRDSL
jgi:2,5-dioxopentanoate dehydrogenase